MNFVEISNAIKSAEDQLTDLIGHINPNAFREDFSGDPQIKVKSVKYASMALKKNEEILALVKERAEDLTEFLPGIEEKSEVETVTEEPTTVESPPTEE